MLEKLKTALPLNWNLIGNPVNWIIIILMLGLAGAGLAILMNISGNSPATADNGSTDNSNGVD